MAFQAPLDDYDPSKNFDGPAPGKYHVCVARIDEEGGKGGEMIVDFEVLAGTPANSEGRIHREYFQKSMKAFGRIHKFAMAIGLVTAEQLEDMKRRGVQPTYDFEKDGKDKQLCIEVIEDTYNGKTRNKVNFNMWRVDDSKVSGWTFNAAMLKAGGHDAPKEKAGTNGAKTPAAADGSLLEGLV